MYLRSCSVRALLLAVAATASAAAETAAAQVERASFFQLLDGDRIEDAGVLVVRSARMARTESFEVVRRKDGSRVVSSVTRGANDSYRAEGLWTYAPGEIATGARGRGQHAGDPVDIEIDVTADRATLRVERLGSSKSHSAPCPRDCLIDMAPSALPMFTMTRRYEPTAGGRQRFRWVGQSLTEAQVLLEGVAEIEKLGEGEFTVADGSRVLVQQYAFVETLRDEGTGRNIRVSFNLYVDAAHRPLAFAIGSSTVGERIGFEGITTALPVRMPLPP